MQPVKILQVFLCYSLASQTIAADIDSSPENSFLSLLTKEMMTTQEELADFVEKTPELYRYMKMQMWSNPDTHQEISEPTFEYSTNLMQTSVPGNSSVDQCLMDLNYTADSLDSMWALRLLDAFGKPSSGLLEGEIKWVGSYDQCLNAKAPPSNYSVMGFHGRYAWLRFKVNSTSLIASLANALQIGVCLPSSCAENKFDDFFPALAILLSKLNTKSIPIPIPNLIPLLEKLVTPQITFVPETQPLSPSSGACIALCGIFLLLVIVGSVLDVLKRNKVIGQAAVQPTIVPEHFRKLEDGENLTEQLNSINSSQETQDISVTEDASKLIVTTSKNWGLALDFFLCFSAVSNGMAILDTSGAQGQLQCLHGVRFISMAWIILGHTYNFSSAPIGNLKSLLATFQNWPSKLVLQATLSVDTFFMLSGCLLTYLFLKNTNQIKGARGWISFYIHRYVRLTPVYAIFIFIMATWWNGLSNGPFWSTRYQDSCAKSWWRNLLYINNFFSGEEMCLGWSWYLANDMQFYVISPLFLLAFRRNRKLGLAVVTLLLFASWLTTGVLSRVRNWTIMLGALGGNITGINQEEQTKSFNEYYDKPYTRIGPYLIGVVLGYILIELKDQKAFLHKGLVALGWTISQFLGLLTVYGLPSNVLGPITSSAYNALTSSAWSVSVAWVVFACLTGHGGPVDTILSWKTFIPLSRLTYCAYLVHPMVIYWYYNSMKSTVLFNISSMVINYLAFVGLSYGIAFIATLLFESPIIKMEKLLKKKK